MYKFIKFIGLGTNDYVRARAIIKSSDKSKEYGFIDLEEVDGGTKITVNLNNFKIIKSYDFGIHAIHIHEFNNDQKCCNELGGHYNPFNKEHGARIKPNGEINYNRHVGDLGNIVIKNDGSCKMEFIDPLVKLSGPYSVINRSIIIHKDKDDYGLGGHHDSKVTGHAGERVAYGIIKMI